MDRETRPRVPDEWEGREVLISVLRPGGYDPRNNTSLPLMGVWRRGIIEVVNDRGIWGTFADHSDDPDEEQDQMFYTWGGVISIQPYEA